MRLINICVALPAIFSLASGRLLVRDTATAYPPASTLRNGTRYTILDNDWGSTGFIPFLMALGADMKVLGLVSDTANTWVGQCTLHALALLEIGELSCIPVVKGVTNPFVQTYQRFQQWQQSWGKLEWQGVFLPENLTAQASGLDPTGNDPNQISRSALIEGYPNTTALKGSTAAQYMIDQVHKYPGQVSIYSAVSLSIALEVHVVKLTRPKGALTNIATAIRMNSTFASQARELVLMGGYVDLNLYQLQSPLTQDIGSDLNFLIDPEAAHIAVTAPFPSITVAGNVANNQLLTQARLDKIVKSADNPYTRLMKNYFITLPLWDETAAAIMAWPDLVTKSVTAYMDVNTAYNSPDYGRTHLWSKEFAPNHTRSVNFVLEIDQPKFFSRMEKVLASPKSCNQSSTTATS
ncbi:hypothetical protein G7Y79_00055g089450 [Physcia stellaris]|nr:hypothetical protein G7Y79_00055g089450 [Physcia stellaris]